MAEGEDLEFGPREDKLVEMGKSYKPTVVDRMYTSHGMKTMKFNPQLFSEALDILRKYGHNVDYFYRTSSRSECSSQSSTINPSIEDHDDASGNVTSNTKDNCDTAPTIKAEPHTIITPSINDHDDSAITTNTDINEHGETSIPIGPITGDLVDPYANMKSSIENLTELPITTEDYEELNVINGSTSEDYSKMAIAVRSRPLAYAETATITTKDRDESDYTGSSCNYYKPLTTTTNYGNSSTSICPSNNIYQGEASTSMISTESVTTISTMDPSTTSTSTNYSSHSPDEVMGVPTTAVSTKIDCLTSSTDYFGELTTTNTTTMSSTVSSLNTDSLTVSSTPDYHITTQLTNNNHDTNSLDLYNTKSVKHTRSINSHNVNLENFVPFPSLPGTSLPFIHNTRNVSSSSGMIPCIDRQGGKEGGGHVTGVITAMERERITEYRDAFQDLSGVCMSLKPYKKDKPRTQYELFTLAADVIETLEAQTREIDNIESFIESGKIMDTEKKRIGRFKSGHKDTDSGHIGNMRRRQQESQELGLDTTAPMSITLGNGQNVFLQQLSQ